MKKPIILAWSGGKDSSFALHQLQQDPTVEVKYLLTTLNAEFKRISMHGVQETLLDAQSESIGIPLLKVWIHEASYEAYETQMEKALLAAKAEGIDTVAFGDIFLEDLRKYREDNLAKVDMKALFPLWKRDTNQLSKEFISAKFRTILCCTNDAYMGEETVGSEFTDSFLADLPSNCDPCGENGEFHTFCFDGPIFSFPIAFTLGEKVYKPIVVNPDNDECGTSTKLQTKGFWYQEICPVNQAC